MEQEKNKGVDNAMKGSTKQDPIDSIAWAAGFLWAGLVLLAETTGFADNFNWWNAWGVFFIGLGSIVMTLVLVQLLIPEYRHRIVEGIVVGVVLLGLGFGLNWFWAPVLIAIAAVILVRAFVISNN